jgi:hypothetical protein
LIYERKYLKDTDTHVVAPQSAEPQRELMNTVLHSGVDSISKLNESHVRRNSQA